MRENPHTAYAEDYMIINERLPVFIRDKNINMK